MGINTIQIKPIERDQRNSVHGALPEIHRSKDAGTGVYSEYQ